MIFEPPANNEQETVIETFSYQTFNDCKHRIIFRVKRHTIQFNTLKIEKQMDCRKEELGGNSSMIFFTAMVPFFTISAYCYVQSLWIHENISLPKKAVYLNPTEWKFSELTTNKNETRRQSIQVTGIWSYKLPSKRRAKKLFTLNREKIL